LSVQKFKCVVGQSLDGVPRADTCIQVDPRLTIAACWIKPAARIGRRQSSLGILRFQLIQWLPAQNHPYN
jgi:hypothetical protein